MGKKIFIYHTQCPFKGKFGKGASGCRQDEAAQVSIITKSICITVTHYVSVL